MADQTTDYFAAFICLRGDVDNLGLTKEGCFGLCDCRGRNWICWQVREPSVISEFETVLTDAQALQVKLRELGYFSTGGAYAFVFMTRLPEPISWEDQIEQLRERLGTEADEEDEGEEWKQGS